MYSQPLIFEKKKKIAGGKLSEHKTLMVCEFNVLLYTSTIRILNAVSEIIPIQRLTLIFNDDFIKSLTPTSY